MNKAIKKRLVKLQQLVNYDDTDEIVNAYFDHERKLWAILSSGNSFGGKVMEYITEEEYQKRYTVFEGTLFYHDRRGQ